MKNSRLHFSKFILLLIFSNLTHCTHWGRDFSRKPRFFENVDPLFSREFDCASSDCSNFAISYWVQFLDSSSGKYLVLSLDGLEVVSVAVDPTISVSKREILGGENSFKLTHSGSETYSDWDLVKLQISIKTFVIEVISEVNQMELNGIVSLAINPSRAKFLFCKSDSIFGNCEM